MENKLTKNEEKLLKFSSKEIKNVIQLSGKPVTNFKSFLNRFFTRKMTIIALTIFLGLIITAIVVKYTSQYGAKTKVSTDRASTIKNLLPSAWNGGWKEIYIENPTQGQTWINILGINNVKNTSIPNVISVNVPQYLDKQFILGTNSFGMDNWTRIWVGLLESIKMALFVASVEFCIGFVIGAYIGFHAGTKLDTYLMRIIDTFQGVPQLIWFILFSYIIGTGFWTLSFALIAIGWMGPVYLTRMYIIKVKDLDYVHAAETIGLSKTKIIFKHAVPNILGRMLSSFVRRIPLIIFAQASLAFLGLADSTSVNLGGIINDAKSNLDNWAYLLTPTLILFGLTLSAQFLANGVNDALEVKGAK